MSDIKKSNAVYASKCIALVCIVFAHSNIGSDRILHAFANSGVAIFFIASGIYYKPYSISNRLKRISNLVLPWLFLGSATYFLNAFITGTFKISSWLLWLIGYNTYLWYLTIYLISLLAFSIIAIEKHKMIQWLCVIAMILSRIICAARGVSGPPAFLNPVNWMGFITLGMLISDNFERLFYGKFTKYYASVSVTSMLLFVMLGYFIDEKTHYFGWTSVFSQLAWAYFIIYISANLGKSGVMINIGKNTLPIYLVHICLINWICSRISISGIFCVMIAAFVVLFLYALFVIGEMLTRKNKYIYLLWSSLIGFQRICK